MFPVALNLASIPILLVGSGELLSRRHAQLTEWGATNLYVCHPGPVSEHGVNSGRDPHLSLETLLGVDASLRWHDSKIVMVTGLPREQSEQVATAARAAGKLVNVEDVNDLCDFYFTANVRRGDLVIAVSTSGASPTLARKVRDRIAQLFGEEWTSRTAEIAALRKQWRAEGKAMHEVVEGTERLLKEKHWLDGEAA